MIGKTRQKNERQSYDAVVGPARGVLRGLVEPGFYGHARRSPAAELAPWIAHYWLVSWDLPEGVSQKVETLPHPNVQLAFTSGDPATALLHGVHTAKFTRILEGRAEVFGVKFRAGGFRAFLGRPVAALRGKTVEAAQIFGHEVAALAPMLTGRRSEREKCAIANRYFRERVPQRDTTTELAVSLADLIFSTPGIGSVRDLAEHARMSERSLQRLFREYIGAGPKWVILRYRMHELVEHLNADRRIDWASVAAQLGYFDQSHLIRDFRRLTGYAPERYRRSQR